MASFQFLLSSTESQKFELSPQVNTSPEFPKAMPRQVKFTVRHGGERGYKLRNRDRGILVCTFLSISFPQLIQSLR